MSKQQDDQISVHSSVSSVSTDGKSYKNDAESEDEQYCKIEVPEPEPSQIDVTVNNCQNTDIGPKNIFHGPVTYQYYVSSLPNLNNNEGDIETDAGERIQCNPVIIPHPILETVVTLGKEPPNSNITTDGSECLNYDVKTSQTTLIEPQQSEQHTPNSQDPRITFSVPHEKLMHTFDFVFSRRFKFLMIFVLIGTTIFTASMILIMALTTNNFPDPCDLVPCPTSTQSSNNVT